MLGYPRRLIWPALLAFALALGLHGPARANFVINLTEDGGDVIAVGSGTLDTLDLTLFSSGGTVASLLVPEQGIAYFGGGNFSSPALRDEYAGISGPSQFGPGNGTSNYASIATGDVTGEAGFLLEVPHGYVSNSLLDSTSIWSGATFASLGLTPGTYTWTWGDGPDADSFTINIGTQSVPEPVSLVMLGIGAVASLGFVRKRRRVDV